MPMLFADVAGVHVVQSFWSKLMSLDFTVVVEEQSVETPAVARTRRCTVQLLKTCRRFTTVFCYRNGQGEAAVCCNENLQELEVAALLYREEEVIVLRRKRDAREE
ncbi:hypothetical protein NC653_006919 [Populus alba x Populus x berolinensis]|uniref:Uncharacterized protein n=1 Tax=Populus alba x Populus x berolinensis TaxID=444605 RepID=A0AAD6RFZ3_9ROSI|nr:hypothetical protein NC653_006919 [Populus alba x Populus x berolinensis]